MGSVGVSLGIVRWDPKARAGAISVRRSSAMDVKSLQDVSENVQSWAEYQNLAGEHDNVETSPIRGTYDWRSYLQEEAQIARRREDAKPQAKKAERPPPAPAPSVFYA